MSILLTGTPGSGKTTLVGYAKKLGDKRFVDADEIVGLCEWREFESGEVLGLVTDHKETGKDDWYVKYGWYWKFDRLKQFLYDNPEAVICGSSENISDAYELFDKIVILRKTELELVQNLQSPDRVNPFGKTPQQRAGFMKWQDYLIKEAKGYDTTFVEGNSIEKIYEQIEGIISSLL